MAVPSDDEMSTELAVAGNAAMSSLCARYAGESSKIDLKRFSAVTLGRSSSAYALVWLQMRLLWHLCCCQRL